MLIFNRIHHPSNPFLYANSHEKESAKGFFWVPSSDCSPGDPWLPTTPHDRSLVALALGSQGCVCAERSIFMRRQVRLLVFWRWTVVNAEADGASPGKRRVHTLSDDKAVRSLPGSPLKAAPRWYNPPPTCLSRRSLSVFLISQFDPHPLHRPPCRSLSSRGTNFVWLLGFARLLSLCPLSHSGHLLLLLSSFLSSHV